MTSDEYRATMAVAAPRTRVSLLKAPWLIAVAVLRVATRERNELRARTLLRGS